ncbi:MAG TPA: hypothetical protein VGC72_11990 [Candidatus Elarobacter sp.]|jgi:hypothetical protein
MQARSLALSVALVLTAATAAPAQDAPKPVRTLTYEVAYSVQTMQETLVSNLMGGNADNRAHTPDVGKGSVARGFGSNDHGTLHVDVIAATGDGGLVVDASYEGREARQPALRVAIMSDGRLLFDPKRLLSAQARRLLPLLSRGMIANRDVSPGSEWSTPFAPPAKGETKYRVTHLADKRATIVITTDAVVSGPNGYDEHADATATYATDVLCPTAYDIRIRIRQQLTPEKLESSDAHVTATLVRDTFAKK